MNPHRLIRTLCLALFPVLLSAQPISYVQLKTADGILEGVVSGDGLVRTFKGIPYAAPPVGPLRWKPPQPVVPWTGVRKAADYGPRPMQGRIYDDMVFHDAGPSEDCLYLNMWMPGKPATDKLPVMVWIFGGGLMAGSSSEPRQDAGNLSKKGVLVVSMNYRLGIFGFFAHPGLSKESDYHGSGNYGFMDQVAALQWVHDNIAAFGGDPDNVTIFGESAGSFSVSALMASPLARGLFHRAIGESGALLGSRTVPTLAQAEAAGVKFAQAAYGTSSLAALRAKPAQEVLEATLKEPRPHFGANLDGHFLPENPNTVYATGGQSHVPLLAGWNRDEGGYKTLFEKDEPTLANYAVRAQARFGDNAGAFLKAYAATTDAGAKRAAQDFGGDLSIAYSTWKWLDLQVLTGGSPVYRYEFDQPLPLAPDAKPGAEPVVPHASDIEFVFRVLSSRHLPWRPEDHEVSELMSSYWTNFAKTGNPNGPGLPEWPQYRAGDGYQVMHLKTQAAAAPDTHRARYELLDQLKLSGD
jgi:para-nitrobenzyl esterase